MTPDLVERVARAIFDAEYGSHNWGENGCRPMMRAAAKQARAAIAIIVEECARVAEGSWSSLGADEAARAIRALAKEAE